MYYKYVGVPSDHYCIATLAILISLFVHMYIFNDHLEMKPTNYSMLLYLEIQSVGLYCRRHLKGLVNSDELASFPDAPALW